MFDTSEWTVVALKRYLKGHGQPTSGLKEQLKKRCVKHSAKCRCAKDEQPSQKPAPTEISLNEILHTITWTDSLKDWPSLTHSCILAFKASDKHMKQGYNLFKCDKVENMLVGMKEGEGHRYCKGRVSPSMKKVRYTTSFKIVSAAVTDCDCTCPAGKGQCKHAMALLYALVDLLMSGVEIIPETQACTSQPRQWGRVSCKPVVSNVSTFSELVPKAVCHDPENPSSANVQAQRAAKQLEYSSLPTNAVPLNQARLDIISAKHPFWQKIVGGSNGETTSCVETKPLARSITKAIATPPAIEMNIDPFEVDLGVDLDSDMEISDSNGSTGNAPNELPLDYQSYRLQVEAATRGQSDNDEWQKARKGKITASIIGTIFTLRPTTVPRVLIHQINQTNTTDISHIPAIQHGRLYEEQAKRYYEERFQVKIEERGFMLHPKHQWLGASADGFIADPPAAVEIKCPLGDSSTCSILDLARNRQGWFLETNKNGLSMRKRHKYYYQCQLQMECLGVDSCIFIVYLCDQSGKFQDIFIQQIDKDHRLLAELMSKAESFYKKYILC